MVKINFMSDLHLDVGREIPVLPGGEVLVLAGDTCEAQRLRRFHPDPLGILDPGYTMSNKDRINNFFNTECTKYDHVIMIPGNHEHYHGTFDKTVERMRAELPEFIHVLDKDCFEVDDVLFIGATMWTDMNRQDPITEHAIRDMMNDFHVVRKIISGSYRKLTPGCTVIEHIKTLKYFEAILANPANAGKKVVMVTHHAPTSLSIDQKYAGQFLMNGGYHSRLDDFILDHPQIKLWIHGHMHDAKDYMVGDHTRVVCNPRGYQSGSFHEESGYDPNWVIEV